MSFLKIKISGDGDDLNVSAESDEDFEKEFTVSGKKKDILSRFNSIYDIIENKKKDEYDSLKKDVKYLSGLFIEPIEDEVSDADKIRFIIDYKLAKCTFDLLEADGKPIWLNSEVSYMVGEGEPEKEPELELKTLFSISDVTADPERACKTASDMFDDAEYYDMPKSKVKMLEELEKDVILISAHGELEDDLSGEIGINDESITSDEMENVSAKLVYFDSCQQGVNTDFLEAFQEEETAQYYTSPITSNDAGDSSTKTMTWFFEDVLKNGNPVSAMANTRKKLYKFYTDKKLHELVVLNKAFIFRMYEFVSEE